MQKYLAGLGFLVGFVSPAFADIGCDGKLLDNGDGFKRAAVICSNTEKADYSCTSNWRLLDEDGAVTTVTPTYSVVRGAKDFEAYSETRLNGKKISGQDHPHEGSCSKK